MKSIFHKSFVVILCCLLCIAAIPKVSAASTYSYGNYKYTIQNKTATITKYTGSSSYITIPSKLRGCTVTKIGLDAFLNKKNIKSVVLPKGLQEIGNGAFQGCSKLYKINFPSKLTSIGTCAFSDCISLTSAKIPNTVTSIGSMAFSYCSKLTEVTLPSKLTVLPESIFAYTAIKQIKLPDSLQIIECAAFDTTPLESIVLPEHVSSIESITFARCKNLKSVEMSDSVTKIADWAFSDCHSLRSIKLSKNLVSIDNFCFQNCSSLEELTLPDTLTSIGCNAFNGCSKLDHLNLPDGIIQIPYQCFNDCYNLKIPELPDTVTIIDDYAFSNCTQINVNIPDSVTKIGSCAFYNCQALEHAPIPDAVKELSYLTFYNCKSLQSIHLPKDIIIQDERVFDGCESLTEITLPDQIEKLPNFRGCNSLSKINNIPEDKYTIDGAVIYSKDKSTLIKYLPDYEGDSFVVPDTVTTISDYAFSGTSNLREVTIPDTVEEIGQGLFDRSQVEHVNFPSSLTTLPAYTFYGCPMKEIVLPKQFTKIGYQAYAECKNAKTITLHKNVSSITATGDYDEVCAPFAGCDSLTKFIVEGKNPYYQVLDDVLFEKDKNNRLTLVSYPAQKTNSTYKLPSATYSMYTFAFDRPAYLKNLYLNKELRGVYQYFRYCTDLNIYVPIQVKNFMSEEHSGDWPIFNDCTNSYLYVKPNSAALKYCQNCGFPHKIWK